MSASLEVDPKGLAELNTAFSKYVQWNRREIPALLNAKLLQIAHDALKLTPKANAEKIRHTLGTVGYQFGVNKNGKVSFNRRKAMLVTARDSFAERIINASNRKKGLPMIWGSALAMAASRLVLHRARSVAYIASGWLPSIRILSARKKPEGARPFTTKKAPGVEQWGKAYGWCSPCQDGVNVSGEIGNKTDGADKIGTPALNAAVQLAIADMQVYISDHILKGAKQHRFEVTR